MDIRDEKALDRASIFAVHAAAFPTDAEARLVDQLREDGDLIVSLVAEVDSGIAGHIAFSRMNAPFAALGLAPVGVVPEKQRNGIGAALIRTGLVRAEALGCRGVFVLGDVEYYARFGFSVALATGFSCCYAGPHFMVIALNGPLPYSAGEVAHAKAFAALG